MKATNLALSLSIALMLPALALAEKGDKGPSDKAYESASENASFKREDGKPGKVEKDKQKDHSQDGERHEHDDQNSETKDRMRRSTEQRETRTGFWQRLFGQRDETEDRMHRSTEQRETRTGFWQRLFGQREEKNAAGGN